MSNTTHIAAILSAYAFELEALRARVAQLESAIRPERRERMTAQEAAELLGWSKGTVHKRASLGTIPTRGHSPRWYSRSELEAWDAAGRPEDVAKWRSKSNVFQENAKRNK